MAGLENFAQGFTEDPGYLDFARVGSPSREVVAEVLGQTEILARARYGSLDEFERQDLRVREAVSVLSGFPADQVVFQPNTSSGLMHAMFGLTGGVLLSPSEFPSVTFAAARAAQALGVVTPIWLESDHGRVTPGEIRDQLTTATAAVAVSLVDFRTGFVADLEGIRQVIGDRLLIVDAIQGFGVVDASYEAADIVVSGGQKWVRAGWGTGFMVMSERALDRITPVFSGFNATDSDEPWLLDEVPPPARGAKAFSVSNADCIAQSRLAAALEAIEKAGVPAISDVIADRVAQIIELADEYGLQVSSPREVSERAGIVVVKPRPDFHTVLTASLHNQGVTTTSRQGSVRLSAHVSTGEETLGMLAAAFKAFAASASA